MSTVQKIGGFMSIDAMRWAKKVKTGKSSAKAVLTWMADMCGADLCAFPSIPALAEATELDKKTVQSSLQYLVSIGLIEDTGERRGKTKQIPVYRLLGVEESVAEIEHTQKREHYQKRDRLNTPEKGTVSCTQKNKRSRFFRQTIPKTGSGIYQRNQKI
jgi:pyocin large subunit-like protein